MIIPILIEPKDILHQATTPVLEIDASVRELAQNMRETMHNANGIGLAAPQVGSHHSLFVAEVVDEKGEEIIPFTTFINPKIVWRSPLKTVIEEGCLSLPGIYGNVKRPKKITVQYLDLEGRGRELTTDGLFARIIQHEIDHLKGTLFTEYVPEAKRTYRDAPDYPRL